MTLVQCGAVMVLIHALETLIGVIEWVVRQRTAGGRDGE